MAGRKRGRPKKMSATNPERKPKKTQSALDLLHAQTVSRAASPLPQGEPCLPCCGIPGVPWGPWAEAAVPVSCACCVGTPKL